MQILKQPPTATPWRNPESCPTLISGPHGMIAQCNANDAAFIVKAVNSHAALVEAARAALAAFNAMPEAA